MSIEKACDNLLLRGSLRTSRRSNSRVAAQRSVAATLKLQVAKTSLPVLPTMLQVVCVVVPESLTTTCLKLTDAHGQNQAQNHGDLHFAESLRQ
jgi:hypothetical protein